MHHLTLHSTSRGRPTFTEITEFTANPSDTKVHSSSMYTRLMIAVEDGTAKSVRLKRVCENLVSVPQGRLKVVPDYIATYFRVILPRFSPETKSANTPIVERIKQFAERKNATAAKLSLAWLLARKTVYRANSCPRGYS
jgi:hypothetical protein